MKTGEILMLNTMKKELANMSRIADRAKAAVDESVEITSEIFAIHKEFVAIVNSSETSATQLKKLEALEKRLARADKIMKKDFIKLTDKQYQAESDKDALAEEIHRLEFRMALRSR